MILIKKHSKFIKFIEDSFMSNAMQKFDNLLTREDTMTVSQLEKEGAKDIWVLNTSTGNMRGTVQFQVLNGQGTHVHIEVPYTFVAINLADNSAPENILSSDAFRRAVNRRLLTIVSPEYAMQLNSTPDAQLELETISKGVSVGVAESAETILGGGDLKQNRRKVQVNNPVNVGLDEDSEVDSESVIDPNILGIMRNDRLSSTEKLNQLRNNRGLIKPVDAYYIQAVASLGDDDDVDELVEASAKIIAQFRNKYTKDELSNARRAAKRYLDNAS